MKRKLVVLAMVGLLMAADKPKGDAAKIEGKWEVVSGTINGKEEELQGDTVTFKDGKLTYKGKDAEHEGTFKLDATKTPKQIDLVPSDGDLAGKTVKGIYALEKGELKLCLAHEADGERPKEFTSEEGSQRILIVLKR